MASEHLAPFQPLPWQIEPWRDKAPVLLLTGSAGGGKSRLAGEKIHGYCLKYPDATGVMLRKTRESMTNSTVLFMARGVIDKDKAVNYFSSKSRFEYDNGSILAYGGMKNEEQREQIRSIGQDGSVDIAWMEEANKFTEDDFNELLARMRGTAAPWRQVILTTNPDAPTHWIKKRLIDGGEASVHYSGALDNPHNPEGYIEQLDKLTGVLKERLVHGRWVQAEGAVYDGFDESIHLIDPFPIPEDWRVIRAVDFGYTNPFVCQWWAIDHDGRMYLYREIYMTRRTVRVHAGQIHDNTDRTIEATVTDHDAEDRATLEENRIYTDMADKRVMPGIQAVQERLKVQGDGKPRLFVMRGALVERDWRLEDEKRPISTLEEFSAYVWNDKVTKDEPTKVDDHGMDAMRYAVMYLDGQWAGPAVVELW
ncbi:MAG: PBSX family phage terminase large subunit [Anaerolineae bacterium]|nr:PBSX family phage terminase large subunit [Anaerolineae bacterium]